MRSDYVETLIIGSDYISTLSSLLAFEKKGSVALLHDHNFFQEPSYISKLNALDFHYLKAIGDKYSIEQLSNLEKYVIESEFMFHSDDTSVILGQSFKENFLECQRKIPEIFDHEVLGAFDLEGINTRHKRYLDEIANKVLNLADITKFREAILIDDYNYFKNLKAIISTSDESKRTLRGLCGLYENYIPKTVDNHSLNLLILNIFSPFYLLDAVKLNRELLLELKSRGGQIIDDKIESFSVDGKKMNGVKLESLDRTFHFEEMIGIGHPRDDLQLRVECRERSYMSIDFIFDKVVRFPQNLSHFDFVVKKNWLGTSVESLTIERYPDRVIASFSISSDLQTKLGNSFLDYLQKELEDFMRNIGFKGKYSLAPYLFNDFSWRYRERSPRHFKKSLKSDSSRHYIWWSDQKQELSNSRYLGQYSNLPFGRVSLLNQIQKIV